MKGDVLILDVTAMSGQHVCVAGIDLKTRQQVRLASPQPTRTTIRTLGDLAPGDVLSVEWKAERPVTRPHVEDCRWDRNAARKTGQMQFEEIISLLDRLAFDSIEEAFGPPWFEGYSGNHAWHPAQGQRPLATVRTKSVNIKEDADDRIRVDLEDASGRRWCSIPLQDLQTKLHRVSCADCQTNYVANVRRAFEGSALVRVGLTRPYVHPDQPVACWLQVTNVFARPRRHFQTLAP